MSTHAGSRIDPSFQVVNTVFVLSFENIEERVLFKNFLSTKEIKYYNVIIDGENILQHIKTFKRLQLSKEMITQLGACWTIIILKIIIR